MPYLSLLASSAFDLSCPSLSVVTHLLLGSNWLHTETIPHTSSQEHTAPLAPKDNWSQGWSLKEDFQDRIVKLDYLYCSDSSRDTIASGKWVVITLGMSGIRMTKVFICG